MFDVGFSELVVIALVALIVIGPERLPKVAKTVGILLGRLQRYVNDVKADINREIQLDELKKMQEQMVNETRQFETSLRQEMHSAENALNQAVTPPEEAAPEVEAPSARPLPSLEDVMAAAAATDAPATAKAVEPDKTAATENPPASHV